MEKNFYNLGHSNFDKYPHYVYCTAFLVDGKLADYNIGDSESCWGLRTFIGLTWEKDILEKSNNNPNILTCEYKSISVNNSSEHNKAFENLEKWLYNNFEVYPGIHIHFSTNVKND